MRILIKGLFVCSIVIPKAAEGVLKSSYLIKNDRPAISTIYPSSSVTFSVKGVETAMIIKLQIIALAIRYQTVA